LDFAHVEVIFSDGKVTSVTQGGGLHYDDNKLCQNEGYDTTISLHLTMQEESRMQKFAEEQFDSKPGFNLLGLYWNFWPIFRCCPVHRDGKKYFCSEYITTLLQQCGILEDMDPSTISPNMLYILLMISGKAKIGFNQKLFDHKLATGEIPSKQKRAKLLLGLEKKTHNHSK